MTLLELLQSYSHSDALPMHMPGHKRNTALAPYLNTLGAGFDITEIPGFSNLHDPNGALAERMRDAAELWGSKRAWWLVNGSTTGILAAIDAATQAGDKVLIGRNCHKSVYNACMLCRLETAYIRPALFQGHSFVDCITPEQVETALNAHPDTRLVVLTSPTYEGLCADIPAISQIVHNHGAVLLVDEAHGAHFGLHNAFPASAVTLGADLVVQSLHKTLPSLTQTAMLHLCSDRIPEEEIGFRLSVYQTTSPSYLLMASIDSCVQLLTEQKDALMAHWKACIDGFYSTFSPKHLSVPLHTVSDSDPSKIILCTAGTDITGPRLAEILRSQYGIETEMSTTDTVVCMTGMGDTAENLLRFADALNEIDRTLQAVDTPVPISLPLPQQALPLYAAVKAESEFVPLNDAAGHIAGDFLWAYPPGIPLVVPGEIIDAEAIAYILSAVSRGVEIVSPKGNPSDMIRVLKKG